MQTLVILNDPPYGTERSWNGLRLAGALARREGSEVRVFLLGDAVGCAMAGQKVPDGYYHLDHMIESAVRHGAEAGCCGTCMDARGIDAGHLTKGAIAPPSTSWPTGRCGPARSSASDRKVPLWPRCCKKVRPPCWDHERPALSCQRTGPGSRA